MSDLSPQDRDMMIRTIIGEAADQSPIGQAAVAHTILNRVNAGSYGDNPTQVVLAPKQFEPWSTRAHELAVIPRNSPAYQRVGQIVDGVASGDIPDPTQGATHFADVKTVQDRGNTKAMGWINKMQNVTRIGDHTFGNADGPPNKAMGFNQESSVPDFLSAFINDKKAQSTPAPDATPQQSAGDVPDYLGSFLKAKENDPAAIVPVNPTDSVDAQGRPRITIYSKPPIPREVMTPQQAAEQDAGLARGNAAPVLQQLREATDPAKVIPAVASNVGSNIVDAAKSGYQAFKSGVESPNWLPSFEKTDTKITDLLGNEKPASGVKMTAPGTALGVLGGLVGMPASLLTGPIKSAQDQLEKLTGNKDFAEKAMMMLPTGQFAKIANELRPTVKATRSIADLVPDHYLQDTISAAERNPTLSLADVSQSARNRADMIAHDALAPKAQQAVMDFVDNRKNALSGDLRQSLEVLGELPTPYTVVNKIKARAAETGRTVLNPFVAKAKDANITSVVNNIDDVLAKADASGLKRTPLHDELAQLREDLRGGRKDRDQMFLETKGDQGLHWKQSELRQKADDLLHSSVGSERNLGGKLMEYRNKLVDAIEAANPGYKEKLAQFRTDKQVDRSFERGLNINKKPGTTSESILEHSGEAWKDWVKNPATHPDEIATARLGAMSWMVQDLEGMRSGKKLMESPKDKVLQDKLEALFGKDTANEYINLMRDTHRKAQSAAEIGGRGSQTFARGREAEASPVRVPGKGAATPGTLQSLALLGSGAMAETIPLLSNFHGWPTALGLGAAAARAGYSGIKSGYENLRYKSDLARRMAEAKLVTKPFAEQPDLLQMLRSRRDDLGGGNKLRDLTSSPVLQALPR